MTKKDESGIGDFEGAFSSVPHASGLRLLLAIATQHSMHTDHVDISQAFTQGELLDGDGKNGKVYISAPPGYPEDPAYCYLLKVASLRHAQRCPCVVYDYERIPQDRRLFQGRL